VRKAKFLSLKVMKLSFYTMTHVGPIKILSNYQDLITLKNIYQYAQFLNSYSQKRDRTERIKQWYGNFPSSPIGLFIENLLLPCVQGGKRKFKLLSQPQSLKFLALLLCIESRKINKYIISIIT
jgi:hypothetical protein